MKIYIENALVILIATASIISVSCTFCPEGMIWSKCGRHKSCAQPKGPKGYVLKCGPPGCTCSLHLVMREKDRKCVKKEECSGSLTTVSPPKAPTPPKVTTPAPVGKCPEGMFLDVCGHHKCRFSCTHPLGPKGCVPKCGPPGCTCLLHLVMRETDGKCVKKEECSSSLTTVSPPEVTTPSKVTTPPKVTTPATLNPTTHSPQKPYRPQPGPPYPDKPSSPKIPSYPQPGLPYPDKPSSPKIPSYPQPGLPYPDKPSSPKIPSYPQPGLPYPDKPSSPKIPSYPQPGLPYPDKPSSPKIPSYPQPGLPYPDKPSSPKIPSYPQRVPPHTGQFSRKCKDSRKHSSGGSSQRIGGRKCRRGRFSHGQDDDQFE